MKESKNISIASLDREHAQIKLNSKLCFFVDQLEPNVRFLEEYRMFINNLL